jgi:hypothetical protein
MSENRKQILTVVLEEYRALRAEMVNAVDHQYTLTNWTISGLLLLAGGLVASWHNISTSPNLAIAAIVFFVPIVATMYAIAWCYVISTAELLGRQLFHIETKVAELFSVDEIRQAYNLPPGSGVDPFQHLIGWEHCLRREKSQPLIKRAIRLVQTLLTCAYVALLATGIYGGAAIKKLSVLQMALRPGIIAVVLFWLAMWFILKKYMLAPAGLAYAPEVEPEAAAP